MQETSAELRAATESDYPDICGLIRTQEELFLVYPAGSYPFSVARMRELAARRTDLTVAVHDGRVVGFANLYDHKPGRRAFLGNVVVAEAYRGQGLGSRIVRHMLELAFSKHALPEVHLSVFSHNGPALALYRGLGFNCYGSEERSDPTGRPMELLHMRLLRADA